MDHSHDEEPTRQLPSSSSSSSSSSSWLRRNGPQIIACVSNFSTSYNVVNISMVLPILKVLHPDATSEDAATSASSLLAGMIGGQIVGGALGDSRLLGRLGALKLVMAIQVIASLASACIGLFFGSTGDMFLWLAGWRFLLGIGAGGVYPLAAVLSAEQGNSTTTTTSANPARSDYQDDRNLQESTIDETRDGIFRGDVGEEVGDSADDEDGESSAKSIHRVVLTFSTQGLGFVTVPIVAVILLYCTSNLNLIWRLMLGLGALPGLILMMFQGVCLGSSRSSARHYAEVSQQATIENAWQIDYNHDNNDDTRGIDRDDFTGTDGELENDSVLASDLDEGDIEDRSTDRSGVGDNIVVEQNDSSAGWIRSLLDEPNILQKVMGTAGTWFLFDVVFYGNTIFQPIVVEAAFGASSSDDPVRLLQKTATDSLVLTSLALPGYAVAGFLIGKKTCCITQTIRYVMMQGFAAMAVLYATIGLNWSYLREYPAVLVLLYGGTFFFANYGPNTTTFCLPSLMFEQEHRATWNGLSAAAGKLGALTGASAFEPVADKFGDSTVMLICSVVAILAYALTFFFVPRQQGMH